MGAFGAGALAVAGAFYAWVLTRGSLDPFGAEPFGLVFNSMLDHMLHGAWDVDPGTIGYEAFVHEGRSYAYFGPFPAMLRLPLLAVPEWRSLHVERISCWLAIMAGIGAQIRTVIAVSAGRWVALPLVIVCALSGAPMLLSWRGALIYHEAILWGWALGMVFAALALPAVQRPEAGGRRRWWGLAACAGLCLLTRSTTGAGLCLAFGLLLGLQIGRTRSLISRPASAPAVLLGVFVAAAAVVNYGRWGNPLLFADPRMQSTLVEMFPDRLTRLERYALFDWHRLDIGVLYYVFPVWMGRFEQVAPLNGRLQALYDAVEQPASSLLLTDPVWCVLGVLGAVAIVRGRAFAGEVLLAGGLALAPGLMLVAWYLAFRYRAEFGPVLLVLSCIGLRDRLADRHRRKAAALWLLCVAQVAGAAAAGRSYTLQPFGPSLGYAAISLRCAVQPRWCVAGDPPVTGAPVR